MSMKISALPVFLFLALSFFYGSAQTVEKHIHDREQLWLGYFNQTRLTNKFGLWLDVQYRMTDNFTDRPFQFLFRPALTYFIKDNLRVNVGYALTEHFPAQGTGAKTFGLPEKIAGKVKKIQIVNNILY